MFLKLKWILRNPFPVQIELTPQAAEVSSPTHHETQGPCPVAGRAHLLTDMTAMTDTAPRAVPGAIGTTETENTSDEAAETAETDLAHGGAVQRGDAPAAGGGKSKKESWKIGTFIGLIRAGATLADGQARMIPTASATDDTSLGEVGDILMIGKLDWQGGIESVIPLTAWLLTHISRKEMTKNKLLRKMELTSTLMEMNCFGMVSSGCPGSVKSHTSTPCRST